MNGFVTGQEKNNGVEIKSADNASGNTNIEQSQDGISKATPLKGSHYLVNGALFSCAMDTTGGNVLSQIVSQNNKVSLQNKPFVTINDTSFSNPFGLCMLQPTPSGGYCPCSYSLQWIKDNSIDHSKNTDLPTEKSKLKCQLGGLVSCLFHGQTQSVTAADFESANFQAANVINPFVVELESVQPEKYVEFGVSSIKAYLIDKDGKEKELKKGDAVRIGSTITLKAFAKQKQITDKHVSWALYQLVDFQNIIEQSSKQNSKTTKQEVKTQKVENLYIYRHVLDSFTVKIVKEGVYTVEGMGSGKLKNRPIPYAALSNYEDIKAYNLSYDKGNYVLPNKMATPPFDKSCSLELNIKGDNSIVGVKKDGDNITDNSNNHIYIKQGKTFVLTPTLLFDFDKEFDELEYVIQKSNGNDTFEEKGNLQAASLEINPDVAEIDYKVTFLLYKKGEDGVSERTPLSTCSVRMHSYNEAVLFAYVPSFSKRPDKNTTLRRVGDTLMFGVRKAQNGRDLYEDVDEKNIKWSLEKDNKPQPFSQEGDRILCDFKAVGTYTIKADLSAVNLRNGGVKEQNDDSVTAIDHEASKQKVITHKLKISYNEVTEIKIASTNGIRYNGIKYRIDLSYLFENLAINEKVILSCDNSNVNITELTQNGAFQAKEPGEYTVKATIYTDGVKGAEKTVVANVYESTFSKWEFCDSKRNRITETGKNNMFGIQATVPAWAVSDDEKSCKRTICVSLYHKEYELKKIRTELDEKGHFSIDDIDVKEHVVKKTIDLIPFFDAQTDFMITFKVSDHPASLVKGLQKSSKNELFTDACHLKVTNSLIIDGYFAHPNGKKIVDIMDYNDDVNVHLRMLNASEEQLKNMRLRVYENMSGLDPVVFEASEIELDKDGNADIPIKILPDKVSNAELDKLMFAGPSKGKSVSDADLDKLMFAEPSKGKSVSDADLDKLMYISETDLDKLKFPENEKLPRLFYFKIVELDQYGIIEKSKLSFIDDYGKKFEYPPYPGDLYGKNSDELKAIVENEKWDLLSFNSDIQKNSKARNYYYQLKLVSHKEDCKSFIKTYNQLAPVVVGEEMKEEKEEKKESRNCKCPRCHEDITLDEIKRICSKIDKNGVEKCFLNETQLSNLGKILPYLNKYRGVAHINTCMRKAHFVAQVYAETKFCDFEENDFTFSSKSLIDFSKNFQTPEGRKKAKEWGFDAEEAAKDKSKKKVSKENQVNIANWRYSNMTGNGNFESGDGYRFRGRGMIHLTHRGNYKEKSDYCNKVFLTNGEPQTDWENHPEEVATNLRDVVLSALCFWRRGFLNQYADYDTDDCGRKLSKIINNDADAWNKVKNNMRKPYYLRAAKVFKVEECQKNIGLRGVEIKTTETFDHRFSIKENQTNIAFIDVIVPSSRNREGVMVVFDNTGIRFKTYCLCRGKYRNREITNGDTPTGLAKVTYVKSKHANDNEKNKLAYGIQGCCVLDGVKLSDLVEEPQRSILLNDPNRSENDKNGQFYKVSKVRIGILIHSGHTTDIESEKAIQDYRNDKGRLMPTHGCIRVYNEEMSKLGAICESLKKEGKTIYLYVEDYYGDITDVFDHYCLDLDFKDKNR
ncbi:MAG: DUF4280 domain-containing protein [Paludibacteraceae bacterium]|nr:DUF4280 domain-containing protein [Paludibacteraceae bacterium]